MCLKAKWLEYIQSERNRQSEVDEQLQQQDQQGDNAGGGDVLVNLDEPPAGNGVNPGAVGNARVLETVDENAPAPVGAGQPEDDSTGAGDQVGDENLSAGGEVGGGNNQGESTVNLRPSVSQPGEIAVHH